MRKTSKKTEVSSASPASRPYDGLSQTMSSFCLDTFPGMGDGRVDQDEYFLSGGSPEDNSVAPIGTGIYKSAGDEEPDIDMALSEDYNRLQDLSWLENVQQDPERLPVNPVDLSIKELADQWGRFRREDPSVKTISEQGSYTGLSLSSVNLDPDPIRYEDSLKDGKLPDQVEARETIRKAFLKVSGGMEVKAAMREIKEKLGSEYSKYRESIIRDYGLVKKSKKISKLDKNRLAELKSKKTDFPDHDPEPSRLDDELSRNKCKGEIKKKADALLQKRLSYVSKLVTAGLLSKKDGNSILNKTGNLVETKKMANEVINRSVSGSYTDTGESRHDSEKPLITGNFDGIDSNDRQAESKYAKFIKWAKAKMSEGWASESFDRLIKMNFPSSVIKESEKELKSERDKHEGLAGFLYVDPTAYGTTLKGCEKGGLIHRSNQIEYLIEMKSCDTCVYNVDNKCKKYLKKLVKISDFDKSELEEFRRSTLESLNKEDYENMNDMFEDSNSAMHPFGDMDMGYREDDDEDGGNIKLFPQMDQKLDNVKV